MKVFVTGATGFIGVPLCHALATRGHTVYALVRNPLKAEQIRHELIHIVKGHILDPDSLAKGMESCDAVIHMAALVKAWSRDPDEFHAVNVGGTLNVMHAAVQTGIKRVLITSTAGVFGPSLDGKPVNEQVLQKTDFFTRYERTKALADEEAKKFPAQGTEVIFLHPTRVYGPGQMSDSNSVTAMISAYVKGKWHIIPGNGESMGNYVYIDDVVQGHLQALETGIGGEHYILGGDNISYNQLFDLIRKQSGRDHRLYHLPHFVMISASIFMELLARFGLKPLITNGFVRKYNYHWINDSRKAMDALGYYPIPIEEGVRRTIQWIVTTKNNQNNDN